MTSPRLVLWSVFACVLLAALLTLFEYEKLTRGFDEQTAAASGRATRDRLNLLLSAPLSLQNLTAGLIAQAGPGPLDQAKTSRLLATAVDHEPAVAAAAVLDGQGLFAMAARAHEGVCTIARKDAAGAGTAKAYDDLCPDAGRPLPAGPADIEAFGSLLAGAASSHAGDWPYFTGSHVLPVLPGAFFSTLVPAAPEGVPARYLAFCFNLDAIAASLDKDIPDGARVLVVNPALRILDTTRLRGIAPAPGIFAALFVSPEHSGDAVLGQAISTWTSLNKPSETFSFTAGGKTWLASLSPLAEDERETRVGLAIPQETLIEALSKGRALPALIAAGFAAALVLLAVLAARSRFQPGGAVSPLQSEDGLRELLAKGESERLEFKSTLRLNLATGKPGKEIELASLKTVAAFMNSDGGVLAVGVGDDGAPLGIEADGFASDDHALRHFSAIFAQHIGVEFMRDVTIAARALDGKTILVAECRKSKRPVILKTGKEEEFYVRAGPSSRRLNLSEFMRRIGDVKREDLD